MIRKQFAAPRGTVDPRGIALEDLIGAERVRDQKGRTSLFRKWLRRSRRGVYSIPDLRSYAKLPFVAAIINTILRELVSSQYEIKSRARDQSAATSRRRRVALDQCLKMPTGFAQPEVGRTFIWRISKDLLTIGEFDVELLRDSKSVVRGMAAYNPEYISPLLLSNGLYSSPAFEATDGTTWEKEDFVRVLWNPDEKDYARGVSPIEQAVPLIDIIWKWLYGIDDEVGNPPHDVLVALATDSGMSLRGRRGNELIDSIREDLLAGRPPVVPGVQADVLSLQSGKRFSDSVGIIHDFNLVLLQIIGGGKVETLGVSDTARSTATELTVVAQRQSIGVLRQYIEDLINGRIINDPQSQLMYDGLAYRYQPIQRLMTMRERYALELPAMLDALDAGIIPPSKREYIANMIFPSLEVTEADFVESTERKAKKRDYAEGDTERKKEVDRDDKRKKVETEG